MRAAPQQVGVRAIKSTGQNSDAWLFTRNPGNQLASGSLSASLQAKAPSFMTCTIEKNEAKQHDSLVRR
jgi:hypothetical protein